MNISNISYDIEITKDEHNARIDVALSRLSSFSRSMIQKIIHAKQLLHGNIIIEKPNHIAKEHEIYNITPIQSNLKTITPEPYDLDILFEDKHLIVVNKPAELIVHPGAGHFDNTLVHKIAYHCSLSTIAGPEKLGTVHRLDKGVSGCIIFAKDNDTHIHLNNQFAQKEIQKQYFAISHCYNTSSPQFAEDFIARSKTHRKKMAITNQGKLAQMHFQIKAINTLTNQQKIALIECTPLTGRMHQIRAQLSHRKLPILNDPLYGQRESPMIKNILGNRIALHAYQIQFNHPKTLEKIQIKAPFPAEFFKFFNNF